MKQNVVVLDAKYRVVTPYFDCLLKWNPGLWRFERNQSIDVNQDMKENV